MTESSLSEQDSVELGELGQSLGFLIRLAQVRVYDQFYERFGESDLRPGEFSILWAIHLNPGIRQGLLAQALHIKAAHMTKIIRRFEDNGIVERHIPEDDRRSVHLSLTKAGTKLALEQQTAFFGPDCYNRHDMTDEDAAMLAHLLRKYMGMS
ncbi:MAG: MarR family transcriptional regulator [Pseudomonadota bacterium]|nr:MarR family transcriptional regulator [Pseudomonadota bacterium]MEE3071127.1 MarR family transcriptional regulator [Pseudomonadota bacterium]